MVLDHQVAVQEEGAGLVELLLHGPQGRPGEAREEGLRARRDELEIRRSERLSHRIHAGEAPEIF